MQVQDLFKGAPLVMTIEGLFPPSLKTVDSSVAGTVTTYEGWAMPGSKTSEAVWMIRKTVAVTAANVTTTTTGYAEGQRAFGSKWDDRATLAYA